MKGSRRWIWPGIGLAVVVLVAAAIVLPGNNMLTVEADAEPAALLANAGEANDFTYAKDVAPIIQENCQTCHRTGSIAPMPLETYQQVQSFAPLIKERVQKRIMPPWHLDDQVGIQEFKNDISLSDEEIETIVSWIDVGMPEGDPDDLPAPVEWPDGNEWRHAPNLGQPDLVLKSAPFDVPARGQDVWWRPTTETGITQPRWLRAVEIRPSAPDGRKVTHHTLVMLLQEEEGITGLASTAEESVMNAGLLTEWAIGKVGEVYPENTGKLLLPGSRLRWEVHYSMQGVEIPNDHVEIGLWFYPEDYTPKYRTILNIFNVSGATSLEIPPHTLTTHQNSYVLPAPARLESFQPHMHMRGKGMKMEAVYPNGHKEVLNQVRDFQWKWHNNYIYTEDSAPLLPKGTVLNFTVWHDNRASNPANPDPDQYVTWGDRTVDEMGHAWVGVTYLEDDDFERLVAERQEKRDVVADQAESEEDDRQ